MDRDSLPPPPAEQKQQLEWCWCCKARACVCGCCQPGASSCLIRTGDCCSGLMFWWAGMYVDPAGRSKVEFRRDRFNLAMRLLTSKPRTTKTKPRVRSSDHLIPSTKTPGLQIPCRVYEPLDGGDVQPPSGAIVYFHGGGFCLMDATDGAMSLMCEKLCRLHNKFVVSVTYRLAPEHPFPTAVHDCMDAVRWVVQSPPPPILEGLNLTSSGELMVAGDSAGGNFACVVSSLCRDGLDSDLTPLASPLGVTIAAQMLFYPALFNKVDPAVLAAAPREFLPEPVTQWFTESYLPGFLKQGVTDRRVNPGLAGYHNMPRTVMVSCGKDILKFDNEMAVQQFKQESSNEVTHLHYATMSHGFMTMHFLKECDEAVLAASHAVMMTSSSSSSNKKEEVAVQ